MAKRKAARAKGRGKTAGKKGARLRKASARQAAGKSAARRTRVTARKGVRLRNASAGQAARKGAVRKVASAKPADRKKSPAPRLGSGQAVARKVPALNRERRIVRDDDIVPTPPSSLDLDRSASAVRTGRRELVEKLHQHTETSPAITGGDIDADWESAYTVGDEAPGGDNPTPDQGIVDDIGKALGVQYEDNEELKGEKKISDRDKKRWELDPASSDDYNDR